jgi:hypothetical protein
MVVCIGHQAIGPRLVDKMLTLWRKWSIATRRRLYLLLKDFWGNSSEYRSERKWCLLLLWCTHCNTMWHFCLTGENTNYAYAATDMAQFHNSNTWYDSLDYNMPPKAKWHFKHTCISHSFHYFSPKCRQQTGSVQPQYSAFYAFLFHYLDLLRRLNILYSL